MTAGIYYVELRLLRRTSGGDDSADLRFSEYWNCNKLTINRCNCMPLDSGADSIVVLRCQVGGQVEGIDYLNA